MKTVLVTGGIGSGKSAVCAELTRRGYPVYDCDSRCKALYDSVPGLKERIESELGVPFNELGVIFTDDARRQKLESIVYPLLLEDIQAWQQGCGECHQPTLALTNRRLVASPQPALAFIESANMMDKPIFDGLYDEVWLVESPLEERIRRNPKAAQRAALQKFDRTKVDRVIVNDSTIEKLIEKI